MKKLILVLTLVAGNVFAANFQTNNSSFTVSDITRDGSRVYYNCDSVEHKVEKLLTKMGAKVHSVKCTGGLDVFGRFHTPARVRVSYDTISSKLAGNVATAISSVSIKERDNCHLNNTVVKAVKKNFEISKVEMKRCFNANSRTRISMDVLKAN